MNFKYFLKHVKMRTKSSSKFEELFVVKIFFKEDNKTKLSKNHIYIKDKQLKSATVL